MSDIRIGIQTPGGADPTVLEQHIRRFAAEGFDAVEITLDDFPLIISGEVKEAWVDHVKSVIDRVPLTYTAHIGRGVDLRDTDRAELQEQTMRCSIDVCARLGLDPLIIHYEQRSTDPDVEQFFFEAHVRAADYAAAAGITLCIENIEVEVVAPVVELVAQVDRPNFRMTFDTGHAWLASRYFGFDFLDSLKAALPYLGHMHLSDNTGTYEELRLTDRPRYDHLPPGYRITFGRGDIHLPPYWGSIPFDDVFQTVNGYSGIYMCEYKSELFLPFNAAVQKKVRSSVVSAATR